MSEFMKNKVNFALALLGTLFVLLTFQDKMDAVRAYTDFTWNHINLFGQEFSLEFTLVYCFGVAGALLSLSVYFYAMAITTERSSGGLERLGNFAYALAVLVLPVYGLLVLSHWAAVSLGWDLLHYTAPAALGGVIGVWVLAGVLLRWRLGRQDRRAQMRQLSLLEVDHVRKSRDMQTHHHYDMAVIEAWKALEARLHRLLLHRGYLQHMTPHQMIKTGHRIGLIPSALMPSVQDLQQQWNIAISTQPLTREAAETALNASRKLMAELPVEEHSSQEVAQKRI